MGTTLRETIEGAVTNVEEGRAADVPATEIPAAEAPKTEASTAVETAEQKAGRTAGRARDEQGRLLPGKAVKEPVQPSSPKLEAQPAVQPQAPAAPPVAPAKALQRPSSWRKERWGDFDKIAAENPALAEYLLQRESEAAKGVSTYKAEWERAKPLIDAIAPHQSMFQQYGIDPAQQISKYIEIHKGLALGTPEQKLGTLLRIAQDYQIPVQQLFVQGQDGKLYFNPQVQPAQQQQQQQRQHDPRALVKDILAEERAAQEVAAMHADSQKYPHLATVTETMKGLLLAGLAEDLPSAYQAALRHPKHSDLFEAMQEQQRQEQEAERQRKVREEADRARRNNVSPRTATPAGQTAGAKKGLRATIADAVDAVEGGRV